MNFPALTAADFATLPAAELRYHGKVRTCPAVGQLKNGHAVYLITMPSNGNEYIVRRGAFSETAKGYTAAKELTYKELADATFSSPRALDIADIALRRHVEGLEGLPARYAATVARDEAEMAELLSHDIGVEIPQIQKGDTVAWSFERRDGDAVLDADGKHYTVALSHRWNEKRKDWKPFCGCTFESRDRKFRTMAYFADALAEAGKKLADITPRVEGFIARHTAEVAEVETVEVAEVETAEVELTGTAAAIAAVLDAPKTLAQISTETGINARTLRAALLYGKHADAFAKAGKEGRAALWARA